MSNKMKFRYMLTCYSLLLLVYLCYFWFEVGCILLFSKYYERALWIKQYYVYKSGYLQNCTQ